MIRALLLLSVVAGCTETIQVTPDPLAGVVALDVMPKDATVTITDLAPPARTLQYSAIARFADGTTRDVTAQVDWTIDNTRLGALDGSGLFTATQTAAGYGTVAIHSGDHTASTSLTIHIDATIVDPAFPPPRGDLFATEPVTGAAGTPQLTYPASGTRFPQGVASTLFQYTAATAYDAYRLRFSNDVLHLAVETGTDRWQADGALQKVLEGSGLAGAITLTVDGATSARVEAGPAITLAYSADTPDTLLLFWSASTNGIMRGSLAATSASKLYPGSTTCVGCHALSRNANKLAMGFDNTTSIDLEQIDVATLTPTISAASSVPMGWATYSPDASKLVVANNGILTVVDAETGASLGRIPLTMTKYATHPDWSPDGKYLAVALTNQTPNNLDVKAASIARIPYNDGAWGSPEILVSGSQSNNNYMPKWSPDGRFLAFVHATSASEGATSAELMIVPATGGSPTYLTTASHRVGSADLGDLSNIMPSWGPRQTEHTWLAFVSSRPYGDVLPTAGRGQIWITSLDPDTPGDSSTPAFWLPCQDVTVLNNNPAWAADVLTQ